MSIVTAIAVSPAWPVDRLLNVMIFAGVTVALVAAAFALVRARSGR